MTETFQQLAAVVASHPNGKVVGANRLQKTVRLLQRSGLSTNYGYQLFFSGPYSEDVVADTMVMDWIGLVSERSEPDPDGRERTVLTAAVHMKNPILSPPVRSAINLLAKTSMEVIDIAAAYDAARELGLSHGDAKERAARLTPACENDWIAAVGLLQELGLDAV